jgi:Bacterial Ig-like domain (group 3)
MKQKPSSRRKRSIAKSVLRLPDLEHAKAAVLNSLNSTDAKRGYCHAIDEFGDSGNGQASVNASFSTPGNRSITAKYVGDVNNTGSISPKLTQVVNKYPSSTTVASSLNPSRFGQVVMFTATVTTGGSPTGTVTFKSGAATLGTVALTGNTASLSTSALAAGTHIITAKYSGDATFQASTSLGLKQVVSKALTAESLTSSPNPSALGQLVTFTATVSSSAGVPTGTVTFKKGTTTLWALPHSAVAWPRLRHLCCRRDRARSRRTMEGRRTTAQARLR